MLVVACDEEVEEVVELVVVVVVVVAYVEEVGLLEVGSEVYSLGKASVSEKVVLVLLAVEAGAVKEGSSGSQSCHQGVCGHGEFGILPSTRARARVLQVRQSE